MKRDNKTFSSFWEINGHKIGLYFINSSPLHPRMLCAKFCYNWPIGSEEEDFSKSSMYFCYFAIIPLTFFYYFIIIHSWKLAWPFILTNLNPLYPRKLCAKFGWKWRFCSKEEIVQISSIYFAISLSSPLGKGYGPSFVQTWIPFTKGCIVPSLVKIVPLVLKIFFLISLKY